MPRRVRLSRAKGSQKPAGTLTVARPTRWGNPFVIGELDPGFVHPGEPFTRATSVDAHRRWLAGAAPDGWSGPRPPTDGEIRGALRGADLACWCPLDGPCHADVLLEIANS